MKTTTGIKLDEATKGRLRALGGLKDRSPHWLMKRAIEEYLDREERFEQEKQADMDRWQRYQQSGEFIDHGEMRDRLDRLVAIADEAVHRSK